MDICSECGLQNTRSKRCIFSSHTLDAVQIPYCKALCSNFCKCANFRHIRQGSEFAVCYRHCHRLGELRERKNYDVVAGIGSERKIISSTIFAKFKRKRFCGITNLLFCLIFRLNNIFCSFSLLKKKLTFSSLI